MTFYLLVILILYRLVYVVTFRTEDRKRADLKMKLLTGIYILQANRTNFIPYAVDPMCKMCNSESEDREHFLARCTSLESVRRHYREKLHNLVITTQINQLDDTKLFTQLVLHRILHRVQCISEHRQSQIELWSRKYIHRLHYSRLKLLNNIERPGCVVCVLAGGA